MRKGKIPEDYTFCEEWSFYIPFFDGYLNSFLYGIGYLCERMIHCEVICRQRTMRNIKK